MKHITNNYYLIFASINPPDKDTGVYKEATEVALYAKDEKQAIKYAKIIAPGRKVYFVRKISSDEGSSYWENLSKAHVVSAIEAPVKKRAVKVVAKKPVKKEKK